MNRKKLWTKTAKAIKCKYTGIDLTQAVKKHHNSRAFKKLPNGEYMSRNTEAMRKFCDEQFSDRIEHDGTNRDRHTGEPQISEKYNDVIRRLKK